MRRSNLGLSPLAPFALGTQPDLAGLALGLDVSALSDRRTAHFRHISRDESLAHGASSQPLSRIAFAAILLGRVFSAGGPGGGAAG